MQINFLRLSHYCMTNNIFEHFHLYSDEIDYIQSCEEAILNINKLYNENAELLLNGCIPTSIANKSEMELEDVRQKIVQASSYCQYSVDKLKFFNYLNEFYHKFMGNNELITDIFYNEYILYMELVTITSKFESLADKGDGSAKKYLKGFKGNKYTNLKRKLLDGEYFKPLNYKSQSDQISYLNKYSDLANAINDSLYKISDGQKIVWDKDLTKRSNNITTYFGTVQGKRISLKVKKLAKETKLFKNEYSISVVVGGV